MEAPNAQKKKVIDANPGDFGVKCGGNKDRKFPTINAWSTTSTTNTTTTNASTNSCTATAGFFESNLFIYVSIDPS